MKLLLALLLLTTTTITNSTPYPHLYNPYYNIFRYNAPYYNTIRNYANQLPHYTPYVPTYTNNLIEDNVAAAYLATPDYLPTLNVLAEIPYSISNRFTVVPMLVVSENNMKTLANGQILAVNKKRPIMTVKVNEQQLQCTPAVRIILDEPIVVYSLKTSILFPSEIRILHGEYNIPINVGAVLAPVPQDTFVSTESPISLNVVYAIPTKPIQLDYVNNNNDVIVVPDNQAVVVETGSVNLLPPKNVTILNFPEKEAEPTLLVDEEDEELVNRNPPIVLAPAGIVQSTQPQSIVEPFTNSKESPVLIALREEAKKRI